MSGVHSETLSEPRVARVRLNINTLRTYAIPTGISPTVTARIAHLLKRPPLLSASNIRLPSSHAKGAKLRLQVIPFYTSVHVGMERMYRCVQYDNSCIADEL